jgi:hypothetical protein
MGMGDGGIRPQRGLPLAIVKDIENATAGYLYDYYIFILPL